MQVTNTAKLAAVAATIAAVMLAYSAVIAPASAQTATSTSSSASTSASSTAGQWNVPAGIGAGRGQHFAPFQGAAPSGGNGRGWGSLKQSLPSLTVGQTVTVTSTNGEYFLVGNRATNGTASGTLTFTVTGKLTGGYTLSLTSGSLVVNGTTYKVSSGSAQMGPGAISLVGQGATSPSGTFLVRATAHGSFAGSSATMSVDLNTGTSEYLVLLVGGITS